MILEVNNVSKFYGDIKALDNVSFQVARNEIMVILGPSGCGKTTILQSIGGFVDYEEGDIILNGENLDSLSPEERPTSTVFQSYGLFPHMTVFENITYGLKFRNKTKKEIREEGMEMVRILNLTGHENKKVTQISGGQQQRVAMGRALIIRPKLLLLDEPFSNLDTNLRDTMRMELLRIRDLFNITMLFVTHDQEDAFSIADRILLMNEGRIEQIGTAEELYKEPKSEFTLEFIGEVNKKAEDFVRPEEIQITEDGVLAKIEHKIFMGAFIKYFIRVEDEMYEMICLSSEKEYHIGDKITVNLNLRKNP